MKRIILIICLTLSAFFFVAGQDSKYDRSPYALEHHQKRLALFKSEPIVKGKVIFLGDSITEFGDWQKLLDDKTVINRGIAGDTTLGIIERLDNIIAHQPSKLFLEAGINDIAKNVPDEIIVSAIIEIVRKIKQESPQTQIYVHSILPTNKEVKKEYPDAFNKNNHVVNINQKLKKNAKKEGFTFINLYNSFKDKKGDLKVEYAEEDGLHLNEKGYQNWIIFLQKSKYI